MQILRESTLIITSLHGASVITAPLSYKDFSHEMPGWLGPRPARRRFQRRLAVLTAPSPTYCRAAANC